MPPLMQNFWDPPHRRHTDGGRPGFSAVLKRKVRTLVFHPDRVARFALRKATNFIFHRPMDWQLCPQGVIATPRLMHPHDRRSLLLGGYEKDEMQLLKQFGSSDFIIELGSNIGYVARRAFAQSLNDGGTILCVEPNPMSRDALTRNMARVKSRFPRRHFKIAAAAVCGPGEAGKANFAMRNNLSSGLAHYLRLDKDETLVEVPTRSLGSLIGEYAPPGQSVALICDVEGAEIAMLRDRRAFKRVDRIAIELHDRQITGSDVTPAAMLASLRDLGFHPVVRTKRNCYLLKRMPA